MRRSTIQLGTKTLLISLPHQWVAKNGVKKGQELELTEEERGLVIRTEPHSTKRIVTINAHTCGKLLRRIILGCYLEGVHELCINHEPEHLEAVSTLSKEFIGFDIIKQDSTTTIFQDYAHQNEDNAHVVITRAFYILKNMLVEGGEALRQNNKAIIPTLSNLDIALNKTAHYCYRYARKNKLSNEETLLYPFICTALETSGDIYKKTITNVFQEKPRKEHVVLNTAIEKLLTTTLTLTLNRTTQHAINCANAYDETQTLIKKMLPTRTTALYQELAGTLITIQSSQLGMLKEIEKVDNGK